MSVVDAATRAAVQRRTVAILAVGQVLGGVAFGATVSLGALLAADISGNDALSGLATASLTLGAALLAIPLARIAAKRGRRLSLTLGNALALVGIVLVVTSAGTRLFPLLLAGCILIGMGNAGNLQSRFAATDLAETSTRGRDLSLVVWATTVGGVTGPLLLTPGERIGEMLGMPAQTGAYVFSFTAQVLALLLYVIALRPDPLLTAQKLALERPAASKAIAGVDRPWLARYAILAVAGSHTVMASVMAMTPIHLKHMAHGEVTTLVGITIALHVLGMYGLSPVFGVLADKWGRQQVVLLGQVVLAAALLTAAFAGHVEGGVIVALILLGLGWSAATVAGSALLTEASSEERRPKRQGLSDSLMSLCAATGAVLAGFVISAADYRGLAFAALGIVVVVTAMMPFTKRVQSA